MKLITACNSRYLGRIAPYLDSLAEHANLPTALITVGFQAQLPNITTYELTREQNAGAPLETESPQHGSFLQVIQDRGDDEVIIFTDGDIIMQRPFTSREMDTFHKLPGNTVLAGWNSGPNETLEIEAGRLFPKMPINIIGNRFGLMDRPCYNIGVFAARRSAYRAIYDEYMRHWRTICEAFGHPARQQWLVVHTIHRLGINVEVTPYSLHANGHYGMPPGCEYRDGLLYSGNEIVCLRHKL